MTKRNRSVTARGAARRSSPHNLGDEYLRGERWSLVAPAVEEYADDLGVVEGGLAPEEVGQGSGASYPYRSASGDLLTPVE